jgi:hypothetical protein
MNDDVDDQLEGIGVDSARSERPDRGTAPVGKQELVTVPRRNDELRAPGGREQQPDARPRQVDGQAGKIFSRESNANHARAPALDPADRDVPEAWRFPARPDRREPIGAFLVVQALECPGGMEIVISSHLASAANVYSVPEFSGRL